MAIPQTKYSHQLHIIRRTRCAALCLIALLALFASLKTGAQEDRQPPPARPGKAATNSLPTLPPQTPKTPPGRLMPLRSSDTASGSKVTITSDTPLNDYSAYRSGDRYYIVLPKADADAVKSGMRGRGFDDAQVQRRGNDVVLSFRLQPGAAARVKQRFNRLDVEFAASPDGGNQTPTASTQNTAPAPVATNVPAPVTPDSNLNQERSSQPISSNLPPPVTKPTIPSSVRALPNATPNKVLEEPVSSATNVTKTPAVTPSIEQLAQAQPPSAPLKVTNPTTAVPTARVGSSLGTLVLQNWPLALILTLLLGGIGLFVAARRSTMTRDERSIVSEPAAFTEKPVVAAFSPTLKATKTSTANIAPEGVLTSSPSAVAAAIAAASLAAAKPAKEQDAEQVANAETPKPASVVAEKSTTQTTAAETTQKEAASTKEIMPRPLTFSMERVQQEAQKLFDGGPYDEAVIGVADTSMRELVSAELLAALASRNVERRERARTAFVRHGYFEDATRSLSSAEAPAERASAARTLGLLRDRAATPHLVEALEDPAPEVRRAGIDALAELRDPAAVGPLEELRAREKDQKRKMPRAIIQNAINVCAAAAVELPPVASTHPATSTVLPVVAEAPVAPVLEIVAREAINDSIVDPVLAVPQSGQLEETAKSEATALATSAPVDEAGAAISNAGVNLPGAPLAGPTDQTVPITVAPVTSDKAASTTTEPTPEAIAATLTAVESATRSTEEAQLADHGPQRPEMATPAEPFILSRVADVESLPIEQMTEPAPASNEQSSLDAFLLLPEVLEPEAVAQTPATEEEVFELDLDEYLTPESPSISSEVTLSSAWLVASEPELESPPESLIQAAPDSLIDIQASAASLSPEIDSEVETSHFEPLREVQEAEPVSDFETERSIEMREETADDWYEIDLAQTPTLSSSLFTETPAAHTPAQAFDERATVADEKAIEPAREFFSTVPKEIQERLTSDESTDRVKAVEVLSQLDTSDAFHEICLAFDDPTPDVRDAAARALYNAKEDPAESFTRALREAAPERRRQIGAAIASSGIAGEALNQLTGESRDKTYESFSLLFLMAKAGEVQPLIHAIEMHANNEVRLAVIKLLALSGQPEILPAFRRLAVRGSLPTEVRSAVMEAIYQISSGKDAEGSASA